MKSARARVDIGIESTGITRRARAVAGLGVALVALSGCADDSGKANGAPFAAGTFRGTYEVPTVSTDLAGAATYDVPEVEWEVAGGQAELSYDLPLGLVGKKVRVKFSGPIDAASTRFTLTGDPGTATCDVLGAEVSCLEKMAGLLPLDPDYAVIEQLAKTEYAGPVAHRIDVAKAFASDPIGVVRNGTTASTHTDDTPHDDDDTHDDDD